MTVAIKKANCQTPHQPVSPANPPAVQCGADRPHGCLLSTPDRSHPPLPTPYPLPKGTLPLRRQALRRRPLAGLAPGSHQIPKAVSAPAKATQLPTGSRRTGSPARFQTPPGVGGRLCSNPLSKPHLPAGTPSQSPAPMGTLMHRRTVAARFLHPPVVARP